MKRPVRRSSHSQACNLSPACIRLEDRQLLSGNVVVAFDGTNLVITGDSSANQVQVFYDGADVIVRGLEDTKINGGNADFVAAAATNTLPGDVLVNLQKGNDLFYVSDGVVVTGDVRVQPGAGHDKTVITDATVGGDIVIGMPFDIADDPGNDSVAVDNTTATSVIVATGAGHDVVFMTSVAASEDVIVLMGAGNDALSGNFTANSNVLVGAGAGNDLFVGEFQAGGFGIDMEAGNDLLFLSEVDQSDPARQASINLGAGNDKATIGLDSASLASFLSVTGSSGTDKFFLAPGATLAEGLLISDVESTAPYIVVSDPAAMKPFKSSLKRFEAFVDAISMLP
ncbi:hypothetical protein Pan44_34660 [Caulifigura coniformis]|uniref:Uncharacterized protein n=1 Tax=Caulifigura coniformis TaxID=2527983 RepID=A0A517SH22_9PLAN|nr:hypothetical protein [Caulifigura coniformis]QDT55423.1 hypothetical protein Pan44_34660 [Caulifigura coniformis]